jgi:undecaprenyl-diphosphatase
LDQSLLHYIIQLRRPWLDDVMLLSSAIGAGAFIWWVTAVIAAVFPDKRAAAWRMLLAVAVTFAVSDFVLKPLFNRPRPYQVDSTITVIDAKPDTQAFPSGHAAMAVAGALAGSRLIPYSAWFWWPLAAIIAISRVYIGVHWPSDVIAGAIVGLAASWFVLGGRRPRPPIINPKSPI